MTQMEQNNLKFYIQAMSFAAFDASLYLDTHPDDKEALEFFEHFNRARNQAVKEYAIRFGPLNLSSVKSERFWDWAKEPWPWEMEG